jgi:hypothetical protein
MEMKFGRPRELCQGGDAQHFFQTVKDFSILRPYGSNGTIKGSH